MENTTNYTNNATKENVQENRAHDIASACINALQGKTYIKAITDTEHVFIKDGGIVTQIDFSATSNRVADRIQIHVKKSGTVNIYVGFNVAAILGDMWETFYNDSYIVDRRIKNPWNSKEYILCFRDYDTFYPVVLTAFIDMLAGKAVNVSATVSAISTACNSVETANKPENVSSDTDKPENVDKAKKGNNKVTRAKRTTAKAKKTTVKAK